METQKDKQECSRNVAIMVIIGAIMFFAGFNCGKPQDPEFLTARQAQFDKFADQNFERSENPNFKPVGPLAWEIWK